MPTPEDITQQKAKKQDQGFFGRLTTLQKALLILFGLALFFLVWTFAFGGISNFYQLIFFIISFVAIAGLFYIILFFVSWYLAPEYFSPKKDYYGRLVNLAMDMKPDNVFNLFFRGDKDKKRVKAGKILGVLGIPYFIGTPKVYLEDKFIERKDGTKELIEKAGSMITEYSLLLKRKIPLFEKIEYGMDGDTLFVYEHGWLVFKKRHYLRCHRSLHGDLQGDVEIYDINPVPYGSFFEYPFLQLQKRMPQVMLQSQLEIIIATHEHQADLISQGVDAAVYFNPYFRLLQKQGAEMTATQ